MSEQTATPAKEVLNGVLRFTTTRKEQKIEIEDESGQPQEYIVREMMGVDRDLYMTFMSGKFRVDERGKVVGMKDFNGLQSDLIRRCLYGPDGKPVEERKIKLWPASLQNAVHKLCRQINALDDDQEDVEKKD